MNDLPNMKVPPYIAIIVILLAVGIFCVGGRSIILAEEKRRLRHGGIEEFQSPECRTRFQHIHITCPSP